MEPILIAKRASEEHANGAPGLWWVEYRVRELSEPERSEVFGRVGRVYSHVLENRYCHERDSEYCHGQQGHAGKWEPWDYGQSAKEAALSCCGDSWYMQAESLDPLFDAVLAEGRQREERNKRIAELRRLTHVESNVRGFGWSSAEIDVERDEKERAEAEFEKACKAKRIWSKVLQGKADPTVLQPIKDAVTAEYQSRLAMRRAEHARLMSELRELESEER